MATFPQVTSSSRNATHRPAAFRAVFAKPSGVGAYQTLGAINGGVLNLPTYFENDSLGRAKPHGVQIAAKCNMKQATLTEIELLDSLCGSQCDFLFQLADAGAIPGTTTPAATEGWIELKASQVGLKPLLRLDGTPENARHIELDWAGSMNITEFDAAVKALIASTSLEATAGTGTFHGIGIYTAAADGGKPTNANIVANGVSKIEISNTDDPGYIEMGAVKEFKGVIEFLSEPDMLKRHECYGVKVDIEYNWMQTDAADLVLLDTMLGLNVDVKITMMSGLIITLADTVGMTTDYTVSGDFDKMKFVHFKHTGNALISGFDGLVSGA